MNDLPNELQWLTLCDRLRTLAQLRYCVYDLYMTGMYLFIEVKSCDDEAAKHIFTVDPEGDVL